MILLPTKQLSFENNSSETPNCGGIVRKAKSENLNF